MSFPRMSWHIGDYHKDTGHLRAAGHGAYFLLCMHYWATGGLPDDDKQLAAIARMSDREWKQHRPIIQAFFRDGWKHKRIEEELEAARDKYIARANAGQKGGIAKANAKQKPSNATAKSYQPITDNPNPIEKDSKYAFESGTIRLTEKDLTQWKASFSFLDVPAELLGLSKWAGEQGPNWFHAVAGALAKRNREAKNKKSGPQPKWQYGIEGIL